MPETIDVTERAEVLSFTYDDMLRYAGPHSPGGVANAFKVMQRVFAVLSPDAPPTRREIVVRTPFRGPGARDGFEAVTRAVSDGRYTVDAALQRPDLGRLRQTFVFEIAIGPARATLTLRDGYVTDEFIDPAGRSARPPDDERRLDDLKAELAAKVMAPPADAVYDVAN